MAGRNGVSMNWGGLDARLGEAAKKLADRKPLLRDVAEAMISNTILRFQVGKDPEGNAWEPSRRVLEQGGKTLIDHAQLRNSITSAVTSDMVMWGSNKPYARIHNAGGKAGRGRKVTMPKRQYVGISDADREDIADIVADHLKDAFTG